MRAISPNTNVLMATQRFLASLLATVLLLVSGKLTAQDIHFSQPYHSPGNVSPALTGIFDGDVRFLGNYRSQWQSVPVPYRTFSVSADIKLKPKTAGKKGMVGYGLVFNNDESGDAQLALVQTGANFSYIRQISDQAQISLGGQAMIGQRSFMPSQLKFEEQWNGDVFDPNASNNESFSKKGLNTFSLSTGLNAHWQSEKSRTNIDLGISLYHLNQPSANFDGAISINLPKKTNVYAFGTYQVSPKLDLLLNLYFSRQNPYQELFLSAAIRYHLNTIALQAGIGTRLSDAFIPSLELQVRNWAAGVSYDINHSPFKTASLRRGGPEIFIQYIIRKVSPPKEFKACPVF